MMLLVGTLHAYWGYEVVQLIPISAFLCNGLGMALLAVSFRCPRCRTFLSNYAIKGGLFSFPESMTSCPHCSTDLTTSLPIREKPAEVTDRYK